MCHRRPPIVVALPIDREPRFGMPPLSFRLRFGLSTLLFGLRSNR